MWRNPWRVLRDASARQRALIVALGVVLGVMNSVFYLAIARLPLATVGAIEFAGPVLLAAWGARTRRNAVALAATVLGVVLLTDARWAFEPLGLVLAFANCALFMAYVVLGHRLAEDGAARLASADSARRWPLPSSSRLPIGIPDALPFCPDAGDAAR